ASAFWQAWEHSPVPKERQIRGMGTIEMKGRRLDKIVGMLTELLSDELVDKVAGAATLQVADEGGTSEILLIEADGRQQRRGEGTVHHIATRGQDQDEKTYWEQEIDKRGFRSTGIIDRHDFQSLYFRKANGILYELGTDGPGFEFNGV